MKYKKIIANIDEDISYLNNNSNKPTKYLSETFERMKFYVLSLRAIIELHKPTFGFTGGV